MKKFKKKLLSFVLVFTIIFSIAIPMSNSASAAVIDFQEIERGITKAFYNLVDTVIMAAVKLINIVIPEPDWEKKTDYKTQNFFKGNETFLDAPSGDAKWSLGFSSETLLTGKELDGKHFVGGTMSFTKEGKRVTDIYDDLRVRTIAFNDGSGRGTVVFASIDSYGLPNSDVREIRARLSEFAKQNNIVSINVTVLHQHSAVDTFGMDGDIYRGILVNPLVNLTGIGELKNGKNPDYMENMFQKTVKSIKDAVNSMTEGEMYFSKVDVEKYIWDRRAPFENDIYMNRLRFVPNNGSKETWVVTSMIHCVGNGSARTELSGDYPYYIEKAVKNYGANFCMLMGAAQSNSMQRSAEVIDSKKEGMTQYEQLTAFGNELGTLLVAIDNSTETKIEPLLNIRLKEIFVPVENQILLFAGKNAFFTNKVVKTGFAKYELVTEIGYMEIGKDMSFALLPGELAPELAYGGCLGKDESWAGTDWEYPSFQDIAGSDRKLRVLGLMNDQIGYIVPDNNYMSVIAPESQSVEFVSAGKHTASNLLNAFTELIEDI